MKHLKTLLVLPIIAISSFAGYTISNNQTPKYFHPTNDTKTLEGYLSVIGNAPDYYKETTSGQYLITNFAQRHKDWKTASEYINKIIDKNESNESLKKQAMILAMGSGEVNKAIALAKEIKTTEPDNILAILFSVLDDFSKENFQNASSTLKSIPAKSIGGFITPVLQAWASAAQGKFEINNMPLNSLYAYHALLIGQFTGNIDKADKFVEKSLYSADIDPFDLLKIADFYASIDKKDKALKLYELIQTSGYGTLNLNKRIEELNNKNKNDIKNTIETPDIKTAQDGVSLVFLNMAEILYRDHSDDSAMIFANMALYMSPNNSKPLIILGDILSRNDQSEKAIETFLKIPSSSHDYIRAQMEAADIYEETNQSEKAISILENLYKEKSDINALIQIGHIYRANEDFTNAISTYNKAFKKIGKPLSKEYWHLLYARGMSYEQLKKYDLAEKDLLKALEFQPNHPYILNYLGYSWADQGRNLDKSLSMIKRAAKLKPDDGYIADSLGWVLYRLGDFKHAVPYIENAAQLLPYDPVINDHLGDVYWRLGRFIEAKFQWERALNNTKDKDEEMKEIINSKIKNGLSELNLDKEQKITANIDQTIN